MMFILTYFNSWWRLMLLVEGRSFIVPVLLLKTHFYVCCILLFLSGLRSRLDRIVLVFASVSVFCVILSSRTGSWHMRKTVIIFKISMHSISASIKRNSGNVKVIMFELSVWVSMSRCTAILWTISSLFTLVSSMKSWSSIVTSFSNFCWFVFRWRLDFNPLYSLVVSIVVDWWTMTFRAVCFLSIITTYFLMSYMGVLIILLPTITHVLKL